MAVSAERTVQSAKSEIRIQTVCLVILTAIGIGMALYWLSPILIPFVLAVFLTYVLMPVIDLQIRYLRFPRSLALVSTVVLGCVVLTLLSLLVYTTVSQMTGNVQDYERQLAVSINETVKWLKLERFGINPEEWMVEIDEPTTGTLDVDALSTPPTVRGADPQIIRDEATSATAGRVLAAEDQATSPGSLLEIPQEAIATFLTSTFGSILNIVSHGILVLIFMIFMLIGKHAGEIPDDSILNEIQWHVKRYLLTLLFISALTGVLVGATLKVLGVDFALMFGFLAFLLNFIPYIGSIIATLLPLPVVLLDPDLTVTAKVLAIAVPGVIQFVVGNLMAPPITGRSLDLHPVVVMMALIFFGMIWGIVGTFLATPITAVTKILLEKVEFTRPVSELLAGRLQVLATGANNNQSNRTES